MSYELGMDWGWVAVVIFPLVGLGYAAMGGAKPHPPAARVFFGLAALVGAYNVVAWGVHVDMNIPIRLLGVGLAGATILILLVEGIRYTMPAPARVAAVHPDVPAGTGAIQQPDVMLKAEPATSTPRPVRAENPQQSAGERGATLRQLTNLYMLSHDGITPRMMAGMELPPADFLNVELARQGANWRVSKVVGANAETYDIGPSVAPQSDRDPDSLYQSGKLVATVEQSQIVPSEARVFFGVIRDQDKLIPNLPVEYRNYVLDLGLPPRPASPGTVIINQSIPSVGINARIIGTR